MKAGIVSYWNTQALEVSAVHQRELREWDIKDNTGTPKTTLQSNIQLTELRLVKLNKEHSGNLLYCNKSQERTFNPVLKSLEEKLLPRVIHPGQTFAGQLKKDRPSVRHLKQQMTTVHTATQ